MKRATDINTETRTETNRTPPELRLSANNGNSKRVVPKPYQPLNPAGQPLTIEKLRQFRGFENCGDDEATTITTSLAQLAGILIRTCNRSGNYEMDTDYKPDKKANRPDTDRQIEAGIRKRAA